jgi:hypothetical protein
VHRDHLAHERALAALVSADGSDARAAGSSSPSPSPSPSRSDSPHTRPPTRAALRAGESAAATRAAALATTLSGPGAAVLASIAACEATHAELLS